MGRWGASVIIGSGILFLANGGLSAQELAAIHPQRPVDRSSAFMRVYGSAELPRAFVRFCEEYPQECVAASRIETRLLASPQRLTELEEINRRVNQSIIPERDLEHYGVSDYWTLPTDGKGDCEDYALLKRHELIKLGWPSSALLMTIVSDEKREAHAVLTARTTAGDFILDNKVDEIGLWNKAPYRFLGRQSYLNPRVWMDPDPTRDATLPVSSFAPTNWPRGWQTSVADER
jgi:predicted transglutaminase-like cysteine proteinase